jgi:hypothetical protein
MTKNIAFKDVNQGTALGTFGLAPVSWRGEVLGSGYLS